MRIARALYHSPHFCNAFGAKSPNRTEFKLNSGGVKARYKFSYKRSFNLCLALRRSLYVLRVSNNAALSRWVRHSFQQELLILRCAWLIIVCKIFIFKFRQYRESCLRFCTLVRLHQQIHFKSIIAEKVASAITLGRTSYALLLMAASTTNAFLCGKRVPHGSLKYILNSTSVLADNNIFWILNSTSVLADNNDSDAESLPY